MAYQPIQMPNPGSLPDAIGGLGDAFVQMARISQERNAAMAAKLRGERDDKRQNTMDSQAAYLKAQELLRVGDVDGAKAILAPYMDPGGFSAAQSVGGQAPAPAMPQAPPAPPTPRPEPANAMPPPADLPETHGGLMDGGAPQEAPATGNPIVAAYQAQQKQRSQAVRGRFNGQEITLDPEAHKNELETERAARAAQLEGSDVDPKYLHFGQTMLSMGVDPAKVGSVLSAMMEKDSALNATGANVDKRIAAGSALENQRQTGRLTLEDKQQAGGKYKHHGAGTGGDTFNPKIERANKAAVSEFESQADRWYRTSGTQELAKSHEEAERAHESLMSGNPASMAHALEKFVSVSRGNAATAGALQLFQKHLSGSGGGLEGYIAQMRSGKFGDEQVANLRGALETVMHSIDKQINDRHDAYVKSNYTPARWNMKGNVEDKEEALFGPLGFHPRYDANAPTIVLGTGKKAAASGRGDGPQAAPKQSAPPSGAIEAARARLANPNETPERKAQAQKFLQEHAGG